MPVMSGLTEATSSRSFPACIAAHGYSKAYELTGEELFRDQAVAYLKAYAKNG